MATRQSSRETKAQSRGRLLACVTNEEPLHSKPQLSPDRDDMMLASSSWRSVLSSWLKMQVVRGSLQWRLSQKGSGGSGSRTGNLPRNEHPFVSPALFVGLNKGTGMWPCSTFWRGKSWLPVHRWNPCVSTMGKRFPVWAKGLADPGAMLAWHRRCSPWALRGGGHHHSTVTSSWSGTQDAVKGTAFQRPTNLLQISSVLWSRRPQQQRGPAGQRGPVLGSHCGLPSPPGPTSAGKGLWAPGQLPQNCSGDVPLTAHGPCLLTMALGHFRGVKHISRSQGHLLQVGPVSPAP